MSTLASWSRGTELKPRRRACVLEYLQRQLDGTLAADAETHMRYPTAILFHLITLKPMGVWRW
ncbi:hypothetical protein EKL30_10100 [Candidimonas sp. SYP-B2681]|nr:hypothetical protein EKL30_10100 [Candidimonas sp. SYP-B2681]